MLVLPPTTVVNKVVPKNSFDKYINTKQKKLFSEFIEKIRWANKLSKQTIRLEGKDVNEIQVFEISLKKKTAADDLLNIIDRHIPYHIIFVLLFENEVLYSAAQKHTHPVSDESSVLDWRFSSNWVNQDESLFRLNLKINLDEVFADFCLQITGKEKRQNQTLSQVIIIEQNRKLLLYEINKLEADIKGCKQFNKKVELNLKLQSKKAELEILN